MSRWYSIILTITVAWRASAAPLQFNRDIRPILAENCFTCHGGDKHKGGLRLDHREMAVKPAKSGATPIVPGKPDGSEIVRRITSNDDDEHMPPPESEHALTAAQIELLKQWIAEGAAYEGHWAFTAPVRPALPVVKNEKWCRNAIDHFILARLEADGLRPSPEADKVTLLRRLYLDLIGLPPTPAEVDAFLVDASADAYEKQVDRLLASPHYGEKWARHWLDVARYADSNGYQRDQLRVIWPYRDYVINAFNQDLPYDRFVIEQIAGDELPRATQDQIAATGFLRGSAMNDEGGADPEEFRLGAMCDRMETVGTAVLGLTVQCAQCHSHKYDPISMDEYYRLFAFLNDGDEAQPIVYSVEERKKIEGIKAEIAENESDLRKGMPDWPAKLAAWEKRATEHQPHWSVLPVEFAGDEAEHWYVKQADQSFLATPSAPAKTAFTWTTRLSRITAFRLELLIDPTLPAGGPGLSSDGTCGLRELSVDAAPLTDPTKKTRATFSRAAADVGDAALAIDGDESTAWKIDAGPGGRNVNRTAVFQLNTPLTAATAAFPQPSGSIVTFNFSGQNLGRFRISATTDSDPFANEVLPKRVRDILAISPARRTKTQSADLFSYWRTTLPEWKDANARIETLWKQWPEGVTTLAMAPRPEPRETHVLLRGNVTAPGKTVTAAVPAFLHPLSTDSEPTRLTLARWLVDRRSPTPARAFVNRLWQAYFGVGIVESSEDLGTQCQTPSHPELLDWLACEFMDGSWGIKRMQRLIVTSAAYRQSSAVTTELYARDPYNRLLARGPRFRLEAEGVRDMALSASGLLNSEIGGRSVMPPAPAFLFLPPASFAAFPWVQEAGNEKYRRAMYTFHRRSTPYPMLQAFDAPPGVSSCARRWRSDTPLQALVTLNEPVFVDCARALAKRAMAEGGMSDDSKIAFMFRCVVGRTPSDGELKELVVLMQKERRLSDVTAYTVIARVLLNLDEAITKE